MRTYPQPVETAVPEASVSTRTSRWAGRWHLFALLVVGLYCVQLVVRDGISYLRVRAELARVEEQVATLRAEQQALQAQVQQARSPQYVSQLARSEFGLISPQEVPLAPVQSSGSSSGG